MRGKSAKQLALVCRRKQVAELRLQGWTQQAISEQLGVPQTTVSLDLKIVRGQWQKAALDDFNALRLEELQKLDRLEREAWAAWERSQKPAQTAVVDCDPKKGTRKSVKNQHGNARFLQVVHDCIGSRRAILGIDAPRKLAPTDTEGRTITLADLLGRIRRAAPGPPAEAPLVVRSNVFDLAAELARRAIPEGEATSGEGGL
jgi:hypothetical protein